MSEYFEDWAGRKLSSINRCNTTDSTLVMMKQCWVAAGGEVTPIQQASPAAPQASKKAPVSSGDSND